VIDRDGVPRECGEQFVLAPLAIEFEQGDVRDLG
jgi:hypothetical protein